MRSAAGCLAVMTIAVLTACSTPHDTPPDAGTPIQSTDDIAATSNSGARAGKAGEEIVIVSLDVSEPAVSMEVPVFEAIEAVSMAAAAPATSYRQLTDTEKYQHQADNPVHLASEQSFSTFAIDVDTGLPIGARGSNQRGYQSRGPGHRR